MRLQIAFLVCVVAIVAGRIGMLLSPAAGRTAARAAAFPKGAPDWGANKPIKQAFVVLVTGKVAPGHMDKFKEAFRPLAEHVAANEREGCHAYELSVSDTDPDRFIIYERYTSKAFVEEVHWQSAPFKAFQQGLKEAGVEWLEKKVATYVEQDVGF